MCVWGVGGAGGAGDLGVLTCIQSTRAAHDLLPPSCLKIATFDMVNVNCDTHEHDTRTKSYVLKYSTVHVNFLYLKMILRCHKSVLTIFLSLIKPILASN